jgi:hypothetical protein
MKNLILILIALSALSCSNVKNKYFTRLPDEGFNYYKDRQQVDSLVIDDSYQFYIRQICREKPVNGYYYSKNPSATAAVVRCDCDDQTITYPKERLEIQYLLISTKHKKFAYISTMPPSVSNGGMLYNSPLFDIDNYININYFNTFFFGELNSDTLNFKTTRKNEIVKKVSQPDMSWVYTVEAKTKNLEIVKVISKLENKPITYIPANSIQPNMKFYHKPKYAIGLCDSTDAASLTDKNNNFLENRTVYFLTRQKKEGTL